MENGEFELDGREFSEIHNELLFYLEDKVLNNTATNEELVVYEEYKLFESFDVDSEICKSLLEEMQNIYVNGYR